MAVMIDNRQHRHPIHRNQLKTTVKTVLDALDCPDAELSIVIVSDEEIAQLNNTYLSRPAPTNVIAFPMQEGAFTHISPHLLGDVVISADTAHREAAHADMPFNERLNQLLIHGILHLCGFDHEKGGAEEVAMEEKARELVELIDKS